MVESGSTDAVRLEAGADGVATIWIDSPGASVNTLSTAMWDALREAILQIEATQPTGVVIVSAKPRSFVAGADLFELERMNDVDLDAHLQRGQGILDCLETLPMPTVAAIHGDALGGGVELALACRHRVVLDDPRIKLGLPETTLGLVPGWGGTFRLPRLVGIEPALSLLVSGRSLGPDEAAAIGLVDRVVGRDDLLDAAREVIRAHVAPRAPVAETASYGSDVCDHFRALVPERFGDHLLASLHVIDIVQAGLRHGHDAAMAAERAGLVALRSSPAGKELLRQFFDRLAAKKKAATEAGGPR